MINDLHAVLRLDNDEDEEVARENTIEGTLSRTLSL